VPPDLHQRRAGTRRPSIAQRSTRRLRALANGPLNRPFPIGDINGCAFFTAKRPDAAWHREQLQLDLDVGGPEDSGWPPGDNYHFAALSPGLRHKGGQATKADRHLGRYSRADGDQRTTR